MDGKEYKTALAELEMIHEQAAEALGISRRTSLRYAQSGPPRKTELALLALLEQHRAPKRRKRAQRINGHARV